MDTGSRSKLGAIRFGVFEVDLRAGELCKQGVKVKLQEQPFQVLQVLLERPGEVVTREELRQRIWPSDTFVDFEGGVYNAVKRLRDALGDTADTPRFVETIPRRGYRFIATVNGSAPSKPVNGSLPTADSHAELRASRRTLRSGILIGLGFAALLLVIVGFSPNKWWQHLRGTGGVPQIRSIAVLPLQNLSGDPSQEYFADGMTDALITELSQIGSIKVISRTSVMQYRKIDKPLSQVARELGVNGIVEGTVQRSVDRLRITAQLIYAPADQHVWAKSYERGSKDVLGLEQDVAQAIAQEIQAKLTAGEKARLERVRPVSLQSLELYLQGRYHSEQAEAMDLRNGMLKSQLQELATARELFKQAILVDPGYAQAYVGQAKTWVDRPVAENGPEKAGAMLRKALELDPDMAEAHQALATLDVLRQWRWSEAEQEYKRAIELNSNYAEAHARYAEYLDMMGRFDEGMKEFLRAQELDPGHNFDPSPFYRRRQYDQAIEVDLNEVRRDAFGFWPHWHLALDYEAAGMHADAAQEYERVVRMVGYDEVADAMLRAFTRSGYKGALHSWVMALEAGKAEGAPIPAFLPAFIYGVLGDKDRAFAWLERGYYERDAAYSALNVDPCWDSLRDDPRFKDLTRRVGLPQ